MKKKRAHFKQFKNVLKNQHKTEKKIFKIIKLSFLYNHYKEASYVFNY